MTYTQKTYATLITAGLMALPNLAAAQCYADYKAKQTSGELQLHYGVIEIPDRICGNQPQMKKNIQTRIAGDGWQVLRVMSSFDDTILNSKQADAGEFFLRY